MKRIPFIRDGLTATGRTNKDYINSAKPLENVKILEVGCGAGILTEVCIPNFNECKTFIAFENFSN